MLWSWQRWRHSTCTRTTMSSRGEARQGVSLTCMGWVLALHNGAIRALIGRFITAGVCIRYSALLPLGNSSGIQIHPLSLRVPHGHIREKCSPGNLAYKYCSATARSSSCTQVLEEQVSGTSVRRWHLLACAGDKFSGSTSPSWDYLVLVLRHMTTSWFLPFTAWLLPTTPWWPPVVVWRSVLLPFLHCIEHDRLHLMAHYVDRWERHIRCLQPRL